MILWIKSASLTIQMTSSEQSFPVILINTLHKVVLTFVVMFFFFLKGTDSNQRHVKDNLLDFSQLLFGTWTDRFGQESVHGCL